MNNILAIPSNWNYFLSVNIRFTHVLIVMSGSNTSVELFCHCCLLYVFLETTYIMEIKLFCRFAAKIRHMLRRSNSKLKCQSQTWTELGQGCIRRCLALVADFPSISAGLAAQRQITSISLTIIGFEIYYSLICRHLSPWDLARSFRDENI